MDATSMLDAIKAFVETCQKNSEKYDLSSHHEEKISQPSQDDATSTDLSLADSQVENFTIEIYKGKEAI